MFKRRANLSENELYELYVNQCLTMAEIAERYNIGESSVRRKLHALGVVTRPRGPKSSRNLPHHELDEAALRELYLEKKLSIPQIAELYGWGRETVRQRMIEYGIPVRSFSQATLVQHGTHDEYKNFSGDLYEKAYMLGFRLGDLHVRRLHETSEVITISCGSTKSEQIELVERLFEPYGHISTSKHLRLDFDGVIETRIQCSLNGTFEFLEEYVSELPHWILQHDDIFIAFLGGFTDAEGSFQIVKYKNETPRARYSLKNTDKRILEQCHAKLVAMGIEPTSIVLAYKGGWVSKRGVRANKDLWMFNIEQKETLLQFIDIISPHIYHAQRRADMQLARENVEWRNSKEFQAEATKKRVAGIRATNEAKKRNRN